VTGYEVAALVLSAAGLGTGVVQNERSQSAQRASRRDQKDAQRKAENNAISQQRQEEIATNRANRKKPDLARILAGEADGALGGLSTTLLTGANGIDPARLRLGGGSLLGGN
jgi:uncharacterized protein HemX